ncbi:MAG: universal stress protein [bacterium]
MKETLGTIVVGYDFSGAATEAARVAFAIAQKTRSRVHAVLVMERRYERQLVEHADTFFSSRGGSSKESAVQRAKEHLQARLEVNLRALRPSGVPLGVEVARGKPFKEILRVAVEVEAGLIAVGATGISKTEQWVLGSTAERLARRSTIPTLVVRRDSQWEPRRILCPVDYSPGSETAFAEALWLARITGASLHVLHVIAGTEAAELETLGLLNRNDVKRYFEVTRQRAEREMESFLAGVDLEGVSLERQILHGRPHGTITAHAREIDADVIVMGGLGRNEISDLLIGNTTERVLRTMPCSMLTVKPGRN